MGTKPPSIDAEMSVDELLTRFPATAVVFVERRMHCVGCPLARFDTLADVCHIYAQPLDGLLAEIEAITWDRGGVKPPARR